MSPAVCFSTAALPPLGRVELWEEHNASSLIGLSCRTLYDSSLNAMELNLQLRQLQFAHVAGSPHVVKRNQSTITANPADAIMLYFNLDGDSLLYHRDGCEMLSPGSAVLFDADQPFMRGFSRGLSEIALKIPRPLFTEISGLSSLAQPRVFDFRATDPVSSTAAALARTMEAAMSAPLGMDLQKPEATALELLGRLVGGGNGHISAAKSVISERLFDPRLSAGEVAATVGISERQLSRLFAREGSGVARFILNERLDAARRRLMNPAAGRLLLAPLAAECGFPSQSHFSRAYKERFGVSPLQDHLEAATTRR